MPAFSSHIDEEGIVLDHVEIKLGNQWNAKKVEELFMRGTYPSRNPAMNRDDLQAQIAANQAGLQELQEICQKYNRLTLLDMSQGILDNSAAAMLEVLQSVQCGHSVSFGDEGLKIACRLYRNGSRLGFDFEVVQRGSLETTTRPKEWFMLASFIACGL